MENCNDIRCVIHGSVKSRGNVFTGVVVGDKPLKTIKVERTITHYVPKFERYKKVRSRITAHNPACMSAKVVDTVMIEETRKLSKTKNFVVTKVLVKDEK